MRSKRAENFAGILRFIETYRDGWGRSPSLREIAGATGLSAATVSRYLSDLRDRGEIAYDGVRSIVTRGEGKSVTVPVLGAVACGIPRLAEENIEDYVRLPAALFGSGSFFLLRASGRSMIGAGIDDGDLVLIRQQSTAEPGEIVVALVDDEATLKRFYPEPELGIIRLQPENPAMSPIYVDHCILQGVAVKVIKNLE